MIRTIAKLLAITLAVGVGVACTNSGLTGDTDTDLNPTGTNPTGPGGTGTGTGSGGTGSCGFEGTWTVSGAWCGSFDIADDFFSVYSTTTMTISDRGNNDGSCSVDFSWDNASCSEQEEWTITQASNDLWTLRFRGISSCSPDQCTFYPGDDSCTVGGRQGGGSMDFEVEVLQPTQIRITGLFADTGVWDSSGWTECSLPVSDTDTYPNRNDVLTEWVQE